MCQTTGCIHEGIALYLQLRSTIVVSTGGCGTNQLQACRGRSVRNGMSTYHDLSEVSTAHGVALLIESLGGRVWPKCTH